MFYLLDVGHDGTAASNFYKISLEIEWLSFLEQY